MTNELTASKVPEKKIAKVKQAAVSTNVTGQGWPVGQYQEGARLTTASLIYGIGGAAIFAVAIYFLFTGKWLTGLMVMLPSVSLLGFAVHFIDKSD